VMNGLQTGRWVSTTKEEKWLLASTPIGTTKYVIFLWLDESLWSLRNSFFSNIAGLLGALFVFPASIFNLVLVCLFIFCIYLLISLVMTLLQYYILKKSIYLGCVNNFV